MTIVKGFSHPNFSCRFLVLGEHPNSLSCPLVDSGFRRLLLDVISGLGKVSECEEPLGESRGMVGMGQASSRRDNEG